MYTEQMQRMLNANKAFVDSISHAELDQLMSKFDDIEIDDSMLENSQLLGYKRFHQFYSSLYDNYKDRDFFSLFNPQFNKEIKVKQTNSQDLSLGLFLLYTPYKSIKCKLN